jgi:hypothetical protein
MVFAIEQDDFDRRATKPLRRPQPGESTADDDNSMQGHKRLRDRVGPKN